MSCTTTHALVDYFNVADLPAHRRPTFRDHNEALNGIVSQLLNQTRQLAPRTQSLRIRLYGGWHDERTDDHTAARQELGVIARRHYPSSGRPSGVVVDMADALMARPRHQLSHTLRSWSGLPAIRIRRPDHCGDPGHCPIGDLRHWQRNRCPKRTACRVTSRDAIATERQKLVDTAIVADTIHFARYYEADWIAVVSNDDDILPGLVAGAADHGRLMLVTMNRSKPSSYADLLSRMAVEYHALG